MPSTHTKRKSRLLVLLLATVVAGAGLTAQTPTSNDGYFLPVRTVETAGRSFVLGLDSIDLTALKVAPLFLATFSDDSEMALIDVRLQGSLRTASLTVRPIATSEVDPSSIGMLYVEHPIDTAGWGPMRRAAAAGLYFGEEESLVVDGTAISGPIDEEERVAKIVTVLRQTAANIVSSGEVHSSLSTPVGEGRFPERSVVEFLADLEAGEVRNFYRYVVAHPSDFRGLSPSISGALAYWITLGAPIDVTDIIGALLATSGRERRDALIKNRTAIESSSNVTDWAIEAESMALSGNLIRATSLAELSLDAATTFGDEGARGWSRFVLARIADMEGDVARAVSFYGDAISSFKLAGDRVGLGYSYNNLGWIEWRQSDHATALQTLQTAVEVKAEIVADEPRPSNVRSLAHSISVRGDVYRSLQEYGASIGEFEESARLYASLAPEALPEYAATLRKIGASYNNLGETTTARERLDSARSIAVGQFLTEEEADILDEIGYSFSLDDDDANALEAYRIAYELHTKSGEINDAGFSLANVGQSHWSLGDFLSAEKAHRDAILLRQDAGNRRAEAYSWSKLGHMFADAGRPNDASEAFDAAEEIYGALEDDFEVARTAEARGSLLEDYGTTVSALAEFQRAAALYRDLGAAEREAFVQTEIGDIFLARGDLPSASDAFDACLRIAATTRSADSIYGLTGRSLVQRRRGQLDDARLTLDVARRVAEEHGTASDRSWTLRQIAAIEKDRGRRDSSRFYYNAALAVTEAESDIDGQITNLIALGFLSFDEGNFREAGAAYERAKDLAESSGRGGRIPEILSGIANLQSSTGRLEEALASDSLALRMSIESDDPWGIASAQIGIGNTLNTMGEFDGAVAAYLVADSIYRVRNDSLARTDPLNNIGTIWFFQGDYERALENFSRTLSIIRSAGLHNDYLALVLTNIGEVHYEKGDYQLATEWLQLGAEVADSVGARRTLASSYTILAKTTLKQKSLGVAGRYAQVARHLSEEIGEPEQLAEVYSVVGRIALARGDTSSAVSALTAALVESDKIGSQQYSWRPLYLLGMIDRASGNTTAAIGSLRKSIAALEHLRSRISGGEEAVKLFESNNEYLRVYEALIGLLIADGDIEQALGYIERNSNEGLRNQFGAVLEETTDEGHRELLDKERLLKARIDRLAGEIAAEKGRESTSSDRIEELQKIISIAESDYIGFVNETVKNEPELRMHFSSGVNPIELRSRKQKIPKDVVILSYLLGEESTFIFVASHDTVIARVVPASRQQVSAAVASLHRVSSIEPGGSGRFDSEGRIAEASQQLYRWLIAPVRDAIGTRPLVAVIPSGALQLLPFSMLASADGRSFGEDYSTFYISDLGIFLGDPPSSPLASITAFANPDATLPHAEEEADAIAAAYRDATVYTGSEATESRAKGVGSVGTLHFATHGQLDYTNVEESWLMLAPEPDGTEDGRLTLSEIWSIPNLSDVRLVTLSACNSAVGEDVEAGWPINPANAFLQVGVPTVVATLWQVDDRATSRLMQQFYDELGNVGAAEALARAQRSLASTAEYAEPYYWAPFVLLGDWR